MFLVAFASASEAKSNALEGKNINIYLAGASNARIDFGAGKLSDMLKQNGFEVTVLPKKAKMPLTRKVKTIFIAISTGGLMEGAGLAVRITNMVLMFIF